MSEKLSAFVDNEMSELEERQVLSELEKDEALKAKWDRYHLIGAAMRNELGQRSPDSVREAVQAAVAQEPGGKRSMGMFAKAVGGLAIAAGVAAVAIMSLQTTPVGPREQGAAVAQNAPVVKETVAQTPAVQPKVVADTRKPSAATNPLNAYLAEHNEFAPTAGMGNMLPYVRTVNHEENQ